MGLGKLSLLLAAEYLLEDAIVSYGYGKLMMVQNRNQAPQLTQRMPLLV